MKRSRKFRGMRTHGRGEKRGRGRGNKGGSGRTGLFKHKRMSKAAIEYRKTHNVGFINFGKEFKVYKLIDLINENIENLENINLVGNYIRILLNNYKLIGEILEKKQIEKLNINLVNCKEIKIKNNSFVKVNFL